MLLDGDTLRAAYQALVSLMVVNGFLPFLYIFGSAWKAGKRWSALSGWGITLLAILCSAVPAAEVTNVWLFEMKIAVGTLLISLECRACCTSETGSEDHLEIALDEEPVALLRPVRFYANIR